MFLPGLFSVCNDIKCQECSKDRKRHAEIIAKQTIKERVLGSHNAISLIKSVLSDLAMRFASYGDKFKAFVDYAEKNFMKLDLYLIYEGRTMIE